MLRRRLRTACADVLPICGPSGDGDERKCSPEPGIVNRAKCGQVGQKRDRGKDPIRPANRTPVDAEGTRKQQRTQCPHPVSYTHLTLPTIVRV